MVLEIQDVLAESLEWSEDSSLPAVINQTGLTQIFDVDTQAQISAIYTQDRLPVIDFSPFGGRIAVGGRSFEAARTTQSYTNPDTHLIQSLDNGVI
jgi:WD40 repeat protein